MQGFQCENWASPGAVRLVGHAVNNWTQTLTLLFTICVTLVMLFFSFSEPHCFDVPVGITMFTSTVLL